MLGPHGNGDNTEAQTYIVTAHYRAIFDRDAAIKQSAHSRYTWRTAYARAAESRLSGEPGQDYLTVASRADQFLFALCDGVSQSFYGEIAARLLGDSLLTWLEKLPAADHSGAPTPSLTALLQSLIIPATAVIHAHPIPSVAPELLREVLEEKRNLGSQATFACGRIDLPGPGLPDGRCLLAWLGDSRIRIWAPSPGREVEVTPLLGDTFHTSERWSSLQGPIGEPHLYITPLQQEGRWHLSRLKAYTDGLSLLDEITSPLSASELQQLIDTAGGEPTSDDIALLELWLNENGEETHATGPGDGQTE